MVCTMAWPELCVTGETPVLRSNLVLVLSTKSRLRGNDGHDGFTMVPLFEVV